MNLGLVCLRHNQSMKKGFVGIKTFNKATELERFNKLEKASVENLQTTFNNIQYCIDNNIKGYRISSNLIPFSELWDWESSIFITYTMNRINKLASSNNITLIIHPDQFCIINSPDNKVVQNSINILKQHELLCNYMGIKHIILHTGGVYGDKDKAITSFIDNYLNLSDSLQILVALENCHYFSANDIKLISDLCGVNTVYDLHHERIINNDVNTLTHKLNIARLKPVICHISSGKSSVIDKSHADYISDDDIEVFSEVLKYYNGIIEVEAKMKDLAIIKIKNLTNKLK
jgi:UV DNA damage endonuclease